MPFLAILASMSKQPEKPWGAWLLELCVILRHPKVSFFMTINSKCHFLAFWAISQLYDMTVTLYNFQQSLNYGLSWVNKFSLTWSVKGNRINNWDLRKINKPQYKIYNIWLLCFLGNLYLWESLSNSTV